MARSIIAVIVSYIAMFILNFIGFVCLYMVVGPSQAFKPRVYLASNRWIVMTFVMAFVVAIIGGLICAAIAKGGKAPFALAVVVIVVGWSMAFLELKKASDKAGIARPAVVSMKDVMLNAYWPNWVPFTFPILGAIGVSIGGRLRKRS